VNVMIPGSNPVIGAWTRVPGFGVLCKEERIPNVDVMSLRLSVCL
jgi:hypothetical protein